MNWNASSTRAITSAGGPVGKHPAVPVAPAEIADPAIEALPARAGATVVHLHVRDPETGCGARGPALFREAVERVRAAVLLRAMSARALGPSAVRERPELRAAA